MKKHVSSKKALLASIMSLVLCCAMLLGTTFAWFTDTVTSGTNRIQAGNLDVEMYYKNAKTDPTNAGVWASVATAPADPEFFVDANGAPVLWEPGAVAITQFKVVNEGSLALKYAFQMLDAGHNSVTVGEETYDLTDVLKVAVLDIDANLSREDAIAKAKNGAPKSFADFKDNAALAAKNDTGSDEKVFTVVVYWEPSADDDDLNLKNGAQAKEVGGANSDINQLYINIDIQLNATQQTSEKDSYDAQYDADAEVAGISVPTIANFTAAETVEISVDKKTTAETLLTNVGDTVVATVPAGVQTTNEAGTDKPLTLKVENVENVAAAAANFSVSAPDGNTLAAYDIDIPEVDENNTVPIEVKFYFGKGLIVDKLYHEDTPMTGWSYDAVTGYITLTTTSFSPFFVDFAEVAATVNGNLYKSITAAIAAAESGDTIVVFPGTYSETLTINKSLTLKGANAGVSASTKDASGIANGVNTNRAPESIINGLVNISGADVDVTIDGFTVKRKVSVNYATGSFTFINNVDDVHVGDAAIFTTSEYNPLKEVIDDNAFVGYLFSNLMQLWSKAMDGSSVSGNYFSATACSKNFVNFHNADTNAKIYIERNYFASAYWAGQVSTQHNYTCTFYIRNNKLAKINCNDNWYHDSAFFVTQFDGEDATGHTNMTIVLDGNDTSCTAHGDYLLWQGNYAKAPAIYFGEDIATHVLKLGGNSTYFFTSEEAANAAKTTYGGTVYSLT